MIHGDMDKGLPAWRSCSYAAISPPFRLQKTVRAALSEDLWRQKEYSAFSVFFQLKIQETGGEPEHKIRSWLSCTWSPSRVLCHLGLNILFPYLLCRKDSWLKCSQCPHNVHQSCFSYFWCYRQRQHLVTAVEQTTRESWLSLVTYLMFSDPPLFPPLSHSDSTMFVSSSSFRGSAGCLHPPSISLPFLFYSFCHPSFTMFSCCAHLALSQSLRMKGSTASLVSESGEGIRQEVLY